MASQLGDWAVHFLTIAIFLFAVSSILGNCYYGEANISCLFTKKPRAAVTICRIIVMVAVFTGSVIALPPAWSAADVFMSIMALTNLVAVFFLAPTAMKLLKNYLRQRKLGLEQVPTYSKGFGTGLRDPSGAPADDTPVTNVSPPSCGADSRPALLSTKRIVRATPITTSGMST